jgi:hypothetical protein
MSDLHVLATEADKLKASLESLRRVLPLQAELAGEIAKARFASYKAHLEAGFTPEQALALCRNPFLSG